MLKKIKKKQAVRDVILLKVNRKESKASKRLFVEVNEKKYGVKEVTMPKLNLKKVRRQKTF